MPTISLTTPELDSKIDLAVNSRTLDLLATQLHKIQSDDQLAEFTKRLATHFDQAIAHSVERGLRSPSRSQIALATRISSELGINITPDVLRYQESMDAFLATHFAKLRR